MKKKERGGREREGRGGEGGKGWEGKGRRERGREKGREKLGEPGPQMFFPRTAPDNLKHALLFCYARYRENSIESKRQLSRNFS